MQIRIEALDPQIGQTRQNTPKRGIKHDGQWLTVTHDNQQLLAGLIIGQEIEVTDPKQYGKTWFSSLKKVIEKAAPAAPAQGQGPAQDASKQAPPTPQAGNSGRIAWANYIRAVRAAHALALDLEPNEEGGLPDRSQARAALVNTMAIALTNGRIELPGPEDEPEPF